ncbi:MAG: hypothetical protein R2856_17850 [Caldilineaceae bacterium]
MKLGLGLYRDILTPENVRFARAVETRPTLWRIPGEFAKGKKIITSDRAAAASVTRIPMTRSGRTRGCAISSL